MIRYLSSRLFVFIIAFFLLTVFTFSLNFFFSRRPCHQYDWGALLATITQLFQKYEVPIKTSHFSTLTICRTCCQATGELL